MRVLSPALIVFLALAGGAGRFAIAQAGRQEPANLPTSASAPDNEAAARHARRTACLKESKAKKLVGAQKAAFLKDCLAAS